MESVWESVYGQHDANWLGFYDYLRTATGLKDQTQKLTGLWEVAQSANWWLPHANLCWVSERHNILNRNAQGHLHCESGPALAYPDGWQLWRIDGIAVDEQIVMRPATQTVEQINGEKNADVKSVRIARYGWPRYLKESNAKCIDECKNDIEGTLEALYASPTGERRLVATCPTGRTFAMGLPPEIQTCDAARRWLQGPKPFKVLART